MIKLLIFDMDGTLFDTRRDIRNAVNHARASFSLPPLDLDTVTSMVGDGMALLVDRAFSKTGADRVLAQKVLMDYYAEHPCDTSTLYPGVRETLKQLSQHCAIISNKPESLVRALLISSGLAERFLFTAGGDTLGVRKPDPKGVTVIMERFGLNRDELLMVGDHSPDIQMAKNAGIKSVYCTYGFFNDDTVGADYSIDRFGELVEVLEQIIQKDIT